MKVFKSFLLWLIILPFLLLHLVGVGFAVVAMVIATVQVLAIPAALFALGELFSKYVLGKNRELELIKVDRWGLSEDEEKGLAWVIMLFIIAALVGLFYLGSIIGEDKEDEDKYEYVEEEEEEVGGDYVY